MRHMRRMKSIQYLDNTSPLTDTEVRVLADVCFESVGGRSEVGILRSLQVRTQGFTRRRGVVWPRYSRMIVRVPEGDNAKARETFVFIFGHELEHISQWKLRRQSATPKRGRGFFEADCDREGEQALALYKSRRAEVDGKIAAILARDEKRATERSEREHARAVASNSREAKLSHAEGLLKRWEGKLRFAQTKVRKYRRSVQMRRKNLGIAS